MKIAMIGRGNVGGGLARLWRNAGHDVTEIGKEGGDVADADVLLVAVPSTGIADALGKVTGAEGKTTLDATNQLQGERPDFPSLAHQVKSITGGPVAKAFSFNFARLYDQVAEQEKPPGNLYCGDAEVREVVEQLSRDAGYEPLYAGGLENARALEDGLSILFAVMQDRGAPVFYRIGQPGEL